MFGHLVFDELSLELADCRGSSADVGSSRAFATGFSCGTLRSDCKKAAEINKRENVDWKAGLARLLGAYDCSCCFPLFFCFFPGNVH